MQNSEILAEGELRSNMDDSDRVRDLQDKVADLKAEVNYFKPIISIVNNMQVYTHLHVVHHGLNDHIEQKIFAVLLTHFALIFFLIKL